VTAATATVPERIAGQALWAARGVYRNAVLRDHPRVLCNSYNKAGTHLLLGALKAMPHLRHFGRGAYWHYLGRTTRLPERRRTPEAAAAALDRCMHAEIYRGHLAAHPLIEEVLVRRNIKHVFIYRDPRDTLVSLFHWWKREPHNAYWPYRYFHGLGTDEERMSFLIEGWPAEQPHDGFPGSVDFPDIGTRFSEFLPWIESDRCVAVKFEDLTDPGNARAAYGDVARHVFPHLEHRQMDVMVDRMIEGTDPTHSKTFRKGSSGEWRTAMTADQIDRCKQRAGELLIRLGYETNLDW
jgi:hypothetical protein